eukprot:COSAG01_NODE_50210_length_365_cov_0.778195_1_plen_49_part_01
MQRRQLQQHCSIAGRAPAMRSMLMRARGGRLAAVAAVKYSPEYRAVLV